MGRKVHPRIFRMGITGSWKSKWFSKKNYARFLEQDIQIRKYIMKKLKEAGVANIVSERSGDKIIVKIYT